MWFEKESGKMKFCSLFLCTAAPKNESDFFTAELYFNNPLLILILKRCPEFIRHNRRI